VPPDAAPGTGIVARIEESALFARNRRAGFAGRRRRRVQPDSAPIAPPGKAPAKPASLNGQTIRRAEVRFAAFFAEAATPFHADKG